MVSQHCFIYFDAQIVPIQPLGVLSVGSWVPWIYPISRVFVLFCFEHFLNSLALQDAPGSCVFCAPALESVISPRGPVSFSFLFFLLENSMRNQDLGMIWCLPFLFWFSLILIGHWKLDVSPTQHREVIFCFIPRYVLPVLALVHENMAFFFSLLRCEENIRNQTRMDN